MVSMLLSYFPALSLVFIRYCQHFAWCSLCSLWVCMVSDVCPTCTVFFSFVCSKAYLHRLTFICNSLEGICIPIQTQSPWENELFLHFRHVTTTDCACILLSHTEPFQCYCASASHTWACPVKYAVLGACLACFLKCNLQKWFLLIVQFNCISLRNFYERWLSCQSLS